MRHLLAQVGEKIARAGEAFARGRHLLARVCEKIARPGETFARVCHLLARVREKIASPGEVFAGEGSLFTINRRIDASILRLMKHAGFHRAICVSH